MRVPQMTVLTLLPLFAIATAAQANEEKLAGEPLATEDDRVSEQEVESEQTAVVAASPATVERAATPFTPEFSAAPATPLAVIAAAAEVQTGGLRETADAPEAQREATALDLATYRTQQVPQQPAKALQTTAISPATGAIARDNTESGIVIPVTPPESTVEFAPETKAACELVALKPAEARQVAQLPSPPCYVPTPIPPVPELEKPDYGSSPALSIYIPVGFGADRNVAFISTNYQSEVRPNATGSTFNTGIGVGLGDAQKAVGVELSYAFANNDDFGEGGFNVKVHRRLPDDWAIAAGWNGFLNIGRNDFEQSKYAVVTKVLRLRPSVSDPLSRLAITAGVGDNQFRSNGAAFVGDNNPNIFGNLALRVARPVSLIAEWTGQDLGLGLSIAPFRNIPLTITPAVRDVVTTEGRSARFVVGLGTAFRF